MNTFFCFPTQTGLAAFFLRRSGIPTSLYLACLWRVSAAGQLVPALCLSTLVLALFELIVAKRAVLQPFWLLACSLVAAPLAAFVSTVTAFCAPADCGWGSPWGRAKCLFEVQRRLETLWTVEACYTMLMTFLFLWALAATLSTREESLPLEVWEVRVRKLFLMSPVLCILFCCVAVPARLELLSKVHQSGWDALPLQGKVDFFHPLLTGKAVDQPLPGTQEQRLDLIDSLADQVSRREYNVNRAEAVFMWRVFEELPEMGIADPRTARFVTVLLALNRKWDLGSNVMLTAQFRRLALERLASADSRELAEYEGYLPLIATRCLRDEERERFRRLERETHALNAFGTSGAFSPCELYYAVDNRFSNLLSEGEFNPEQEALRAVLEIRKHQLATGCLPEHYQVSPKLGEYRWSGPNSAVLVLHSLDPVRRPRREVTFE